MMKSFMPLILGSDRSMADSVEDEVPGFGSEGVVPGENHAQKGEPAKHPWGVQYQGPFESATDGSARAVRLHARALNDAGVPVLLQSFTNTFLGPEGVRVGAQAMDERIKASTHDLRHQSIGELRLRVKHLVVFSAEHLRSVIVPHYVAIEKNAETAIAIRQRLYDTTIVYSVWERSTISEPVAAILRRVGECWVPCSDNKHLLEKHGVERVTVVPHPYDEASELTKLTRRAPMAKKAFYSIGLWQPRKHYHETIGAFLIAFKPTDAASLTIKHRYAPLPDYPSPAASVDIWLADPRVIAQGWTMKNLSPSLWLPSGDWPESRITELHFKSNIYVCASRGEAYALPAFDAKVSGNRMLYTGYGGMCDFAGAGDVLIPFTMERVPPVYGWEEGAEWAVATVDDIATAMRNVVIPELYERPACLASCTMPAVGQLMKARCEAVLERAALRGRL